MRTRNLIALSVSVVLLAACEEAPTSAVPANTPRQSMGVGSPRFTSATATGPNSFGGLAIAFDLSGVGNKASNLITGSASGSAVWACRANGNEFDGFPTPQVSSSQPVSTTVSIGANNGKVSGSVTVSPPANTLACAPGPHSALLVSSSLQGVQVSNQDAGSLAIPGTFASTFFTLPQEVYPVLSVQADQTSLSIDGAQGTYTVTIQNDGLLRTGLGIQVWITQGTTFRAANGSVLTCTATNGELPVGTCTMHGSVAAANGIAAGSGTLVPGPAIMEVDLRENPNIRVLAGFRTAVTLQ